MNTNSADDGARIDSPRVVRMLRRRLLARTALMTVMATAAWSIETSALAAASSTPAAVHRLDDAAMALFDAAETANWTDGRKDLAQARQAALEVNRLEGAFTDAGGTPENYFEVQNNLSADLMEADLALSVKDKRWLINSADRIASRAGELSQPFAATSKGVTSRIETLLFLDRRMRRALVWSDNDGYRSGSEAFKNVWSSLKTQLGGRDSRKAEVLDQAFARLRVESSSANLRTLYMAIQNLRDTVS